ncbi:protein kinase [Rhizina undulata]
MADDAPTTSFDEIEGHKENIQPLASGRSARALAARLSPLSSSGNPTALRGEHAVKQAEFEKELQSASELDDPLEVWVRYVNWTIETFPSGHSAESGLIRLLERATKEFVHEPNYKNDPRYLKLWVHYAQHFSDAPRETFAYLARHDIGQRLALFYEEYAALLETMGRKNQADEIYQLGLDTNARPAERLLRKYEEFRKRLEHDPPRDDEPSSPALPVVRPALAVKPFGGAATGPLGEESEQQPNAPAPAKKPARQKMAIFSDADNPTGKSSPPLKTTGGWESIGTLDERKKENVHAPRPWAGEILKQEGRGGGSAVGKGKLTVFRDGGSHSGNQNYIPQSVPFNKRPERVAVDLESVYPEGEDADEYSFAELRAMSRGLFGIDWKSRREEEAHEKRKRKEKPYAFFEESRTPIKLKTVLSPSPNKGKLKRKNRAPASPTMTFHSRQATDEINNMLQLSASDEIKNLFNQSMKPPDSDSGDSDEDDTDGDYTLATQIEQTENLDTQDEEDEEDEEDEDEDEDDRGSVKSEWSDFTLRQHLPGNQQGEEEESEPEVGQARAGFKALKIHRDENEEPIPFEFGRKLKIPSPPEDFDPPTLPYNAMKDPQYQLQKALPFMTPIVETTESLPPTTARRRAHHTAKTPSRSTMPPIADDDSLVSSPEEDADFRSPFANIFEKEVKKKILPYKDPDTPPKPEVEPLKERKPLASKKAAAIPPKDLVPKGPIIQDLQCNPMDDAIRKTIFEKLHPPLSAYGGFYQFSDKKMGRSAEIKKFAKSMSKRDGDRSAGNVTQGPVIDFVTGDGGASYTLRREIGKGAFAPVYLVENNMIDDDEEGESENDENDENVIGILDAQRRGLRRKRLEALKMEDPPSPWEFYIMRQARRRLGVSRPVESIAQAHEMHLFADEGYLFLEYRQQGTILDLINIAKSEAASGAGAAGGVMDETLAMFLSVELLRTVEALHSKGLLHGDLKADNCLVRFEPVHENEWQSRYRKDGSAGWNKKGIALIDFGRGIDMKLFNANVQFIADWKTDQQDCAEMREMRPWTYQVDYHGLAAIIHSMLFGKYIETVAERGNVLGGMRKYKITSTLKRYWQQEIWGQVFDVLLNPLQYAPEEERGVMPVTKALRACREKMEEWLEANCDKGVGLKNAIRRMEGLLTKKR